MPWQPIGASLASIALLLAAAPAADAADHRIFRAPLARPTDHPDPDRHAYTVRQAPASPACTPNFCVHWVAKGADRPRLVDANGIDDGDDVPDFVEHVQRVAEHVYSIENDKLGWRDPMSDGHRGGARGKTDIYLKQLAGELFGYAAPDRGQAGGAHRLPRRLHGYLVLDNDYSPREFPHTKSNDDLEVTFAHEYAHILEFGYDAYQDPWLAESTAVWMEEQVYDGIDDYLRYVRRWAGLFNMPLTAASIKEYGSAVWNLWLARRYGQPMIRRVWAGAPRAKPRGFAVAAYQRAIKEAGGTDFSREFARFARDTAEWRTGQIFEEGPSYPNVARQGSLPIDGRPVERILNHTTFQLLRVDAGRGRRLVVKLATPRGVSSALALVGRIGGERSGRVISKMGFRRGGGRVVVRLPRPGRFTRITAVLVNADTSALGFSLRLLDWRYLTDTAPFRVRAAVR